MKVGFDKILKSTGIADVVSKKIASEVTEELIKKGIKATTKDIEDATMQKVSSFLSKAKRVGIKTATSAATGSTIGAVQQGSNDAIKLLTNKVTGKDIFNEQEIKDNFRKNMLNATVSGGAIGGVMGLGHSALENTKKAIRNEVAKAQSPQDIEAIKQTINEHHEAGNITPEEANAANIKVDDYAQIAAKIPEVITPEKKYAIIGGIEQREGLSKEIEASKKELANIDPAFQEDKNNQLVLLEGKLAQTNDYIEELVTGEKPEYIEDEGKYYKLGSDGEDTKITKEHYDLATAVKEEAKAQKEATKEEQPISEEEIKTENIPNEQGQALKPTNEQMAKDAMEGNIVTFKYKSESEVPEVFKDKISSSGETNGVKEIKVTVPKSLADYELQKGEQAPEIQQPTEVEKPATEKVSETIQPTEEPKVKSIQEQPIVEEKTTPTIKEEVKVETKTEIPKEVKDKKTINEIIEDKPKIEKPKLELTEIKPKVIVSKSKGKDGLLDKSKVDEYKKQQRDIFNEHKSLIEIIECLWK
jgi:hypothetical protein